MIFNETAITQIRGDDKKYAVPALASGQKIVLLHDDTEPHMPGCRRMKKGRYLVVNVGDSFNRKVLPAKSYDLKLDRMNASYEWSINTVAIDKAISLGLITAE